MKKEYLTIIKSCLASLIIIGVLLPHLAEAISAKDWFQLDILSEKNESLQVSQETDQSGEHLATLSRVALIQPTRPIAQRFPQFAPYCAYQPGVSYCLTTVTAYSSTVSQTDSSPFITASGETVQDGYVACNFLDFGTKVRIPEIYGNKVFIVEDRMARKNNHKLDIWFPSRYQALSFGIKRLKVEILN